MYGLHYCQVMAHVVQKVCVLHTDCVAHNMSSRRALDVAARGRFSEPDGRGPTVSAPETVGPLGVPRFHDETLGGPTVS